MVSTEKTCPYCLGEVPVAAKKCRHCGEWMMAEQAAKDEVANQRMAEAGGLWTPLGFFLILGGIGGAFWIFRLTSVSIHETRYGFRDELRYRVLNEYGYILAGGTLLLGFVLGIAWFVRASRVNAMREQIQLQRAASAFLHARSAQIRAQTKGPT
jgi:hypothetical protein